MSPETLRHMAWTALLEAVQRRTTLGDVEGLRVTICPEDTGWVSVLMHINNTRIGCVFSEGEQAIGWVERTLASAAWELVRAMP